METTHIKIQYHNEELTIRELCERLDDSRRMFQRRIGTLRRFLGRWVRTAERSK